MSTALDAYLKREGISDADFALVIGRDRSTVSRLRRGVVTPTIELADSIEQATGGAVPIKSWLAPGDADETGAPGPSAPFPSGLPGTDLPAQAEAGSAAGKPVTRKADGAASSSKSSLPRSSASGGVSAATEAARAA